MGNMVGQLQYGVELTPDEYYLIEGEKYSGELKSAELKAADLVILDWPYETEDRFLIIKETQTEAFNGSQPLGRSIINKPEWDDIMKKALVDLGLPAREPQWYLVGRYD